MGYRTVDATAIEPEPDRPCELRRLGDAAALEQLALNRFEAQPGEQLPLAYHYHDQQEEAFYVLSGTLHVETPAEEFVLGPDDLFAVDPGSPQRAYNPEDAAEPVTVLAIGVPPVSDDVHPDEGEQ
jgi:mannose-6-phosphate isomerase-like protein (cupin superfamily)